MDLILINNIAPHYRKSIWKLIFQSEAIHFRLFFGAGKEGIAEAELDFLDESLLAEQVGYLRNVYLPNGLLVWQSGVLTKALKRDFDVIIFLGEMYNIATWLAAAICRARGKKVVFWGHGIYGNESPLKLWFRVLFLRLADQHLLYGERAKTLMTNLGFETKNLHVVFNSLDFDLQTTVRAQVATLERKETFSFFKSPRNFTLVFIGRFTAVKKLDILLKAADLLNTEAVLYNVLLIGDGSERQRLEKVYSNAVKCGWLHFYGASYSEEEVGKLIYHSDLTVSPGNVGLTCIHSLTYGTPVCTHSDLSNQMPEAEAIDDGVNGFFFQRDNSVDLALKIKEWFNSPVPRLKQDVWSVVENRYNPMYQLKVIERLLNGLPPLD